MKMTHVKRCGVLLVILWAGAGVLVGSNVFNVRDYGAAGDGENLDTEAINKAIAVCSEAGGGTVYFPSGTYLSGSIRLRSHLCLKLGQGAVVKGAANTINAYDLPEKVEYELFQDFGHSYFHNSLMWGEKLENISIEGPGRIDGGGMTGGLPKDGGGDKSIALKLCRGVRITGVSITHGGHFAALLTGCDNVFIDNVFIDTQRDGINIDCCKNVFVSNCYINSDDDGLCLKSSYALGYARPTENVTITNCILTGYHEGTVFDGTFGDEKPYFAKGGGIKRIGRIKFGTESNGGFINIAISNCVFDKCWGLALETVDGGLMENITISNLTMRDIADTPIFIRLGNRARGPEGTPVGRARNIRITNVTATTRMCTYGVLISGISGHAIEDLVLENIHVVCPGGQKAEDYPEAREVPENERGGPGERMFGPIPSYGMFVRHVDGLTVRNVKFEAKEPDERAAVIFTDVRDAKIEGIEAVNGKEAGRVEMLDTGIRP